MPTEDAKTVLPKFPLRLTPSLRKAAETYSRKEGVSLNQFINLAVAEKSARLQHEEWQSNRKKPSEKDIQWTFELLDRNRDRQPDPGDELPKGYRSLVKHTTQVGNAMKRRKAS